MVRRLVLLVVLSSLIAVPLGAVDAPMAGAAKADCADGKACVWDQPEYAGKKTVVGSGCVNGAFQSALSNLRGADYSLYLYMSAGCQGHWASRFANGGGIRKGNWASARVGPQNP
jgi:hypothetical protein